MSVIDGPADPDATGRLVFAAPGERPAAIPEDSVLAGRLPAAEREEDLPYWRAAQVDVDHADAAVAEPVQLVVAWAAAVAPADDRDDDVLRPARTEPTEWSAAQRDAPGATPSAAIVALARWVAADYGETRLQVARAIAAQKLPDPFTAVAADHVIRSADLAYEFAIDMAVGESMRQQRELEKSYLEAETDLAKLRESIAAQADQVVTRALTGALAVAIAALTAKQVRGWPVTIAGGVLAVVSRGDGAWYTLRPVRREATARLDALATITAGRADLAHAGVQQLGAQIAAWRSRIGRHVIVTGALLILLALAAAAGAYLGNDRISPLFPDEKPATPAAPPGSPP